jgi:hypothetical protein
MPSSWTRSLASGSELRKNTRWGVFDAGSEDL